MNKRSSTLVLALVLAVLSLLGLAPASSLTPRELDAQSSCGRFSGKECNKKCNRECSNGLCCDWSTYYYDNADLVPVGG